MENILQVTKGRSLLLITHRLSDLEKMDEIIFLDEGSDPGERQSI